MRGSFLLPPVAAIALGLAGAVGARAVGAPLPWLLGPLLLVAGAVLGGVRVEGSALSFPAGIRLVCVPVIGVLIGGALTPDAVASIGAWWPSLLAMAVFVPAAHALNYVVFRQIGRYDRATAYWCATPGGLIESIEMGTAAGGEERLLAAQHFARIAVTVTAVPLLFAALTGGAVGSASGVEMPGAEVPLGWRDGVLLALAAVVGGAAGRLLRLPAGIITGPILLSGAFHATGLTVAQPPDWIVSLAQLVIGTALGVRFAGLERRRALRGLWLAALTVAAMMALATALAAGLAAATGEALAVLMLSYAPGGIVEMGLIALSLAESPVFVTAHHILRILLTVAIAPLGWRRLARRRGEAGKPARRS